MDGDDNDDDGDDDNDDNDDAVQLVNLGSSYKYDGGTEFLCVVSRQCQSSVQNGHLCVEPTDRGKVRQLH